MKKLIEICWHGRGGQGAKTAAFLFADVVLSIGKYVQAFPEYGPERMGAPVQSFNRLSDYPITLHTSILNPDYIVVLDSSLIKSIVLKGVQKLVKIIVNTSFGIFETAKELNVDPKQVYVVDASRIALDMIGKNIPNMPMLGALVKVIKILDINNVLDSAKEKLVKKFRHKSEVIEGNLASIRCAFNEVKNF
ncbi:MAG: 2-oxoacid:acceptor oxidoreductase family protein [Endomicrobium sp.]|nr:2-oxoacid:acceptor oxidoreductase family protein [Endomicrobium sp.]